VCGKKGQFGKSEKRGFLKGFNESPYQKTERTKQHIPLLFSSPSFSSHFHCHQWWLSPPSLPISLSKIPTTTLQFQYPAFSSSPNPMLKLLSSSPIHRLNPAAVPVLRPTAESASPLHRVLNSLSAFSRSNRCLGGRIFFCSDSSDGSDHVVDAEVKSAEEIPSKSSAIVSTYPKPEDYLTVRFRFCFVFVFLLPFIFSCSIVSL
jgi:hypothetical protein